MSGPTEVYRVGQVPVIGIGIRFADADFTDEFAIRLRSLHRLVPQKEELADLVQRAAASEFASDGLRAALESGRLSQENVGKRLDAVKPPDDDWRLGETFGREYLQRGGEYHFPVPASQDARNQDGSLPGTDYIGFRRFPGGLPRFAFGEVKTSTQKTHPPSSMSGSTGMVAQLVDLLPDNGGAWDQILYLGGRAAGQPWELEFAEAYAALDADDLDFDLVGVLVRPCDAHADEPKDLESRCAGLARQITGLRRGAMLLALYVSSRAFGELRTRWRTVP